MKAPTMEASVTHLRLLACLLRLSIENGLDDSMASPARTAALCSSSRSMFPFSSSTNTKETTKPRINMMTKATIENWASRLSRKPIFDKNVLTQLPLRPCPFRPKASAASECSSRIRDRSTSPEVPQGRPTAGYSDGENRRRVTFNSNLSERAFDQRKRVPTPI